MAARLAALRREHPEARLTTDLLRADERAVAVRAEIALPAGATASGTGSAAPDDSRAYELAESRAVARALLFLGYGIEPEPSATEPVPAPAAVSRPEPEPVPVERPQPVEPAATSPQPAAPAPARAATARASTPREATRPSAATPEPARPAPAPPTPEPRRSASPPAQEVEPAMEDFSWTSFWNWARKLGYQNKPAVEAVIGQSITSLSPAQVRALLREKAGVE